MALSKRLTNIVKNADELHIKKMVEKEIANRAAASKAMKETEKTINKSINKAVGLDYEARKLGKRGLKKREDELTKVFSSKEARTLDRKIIQQNEMKNIARQNEVENAARKTAENLKVKNQRKLDMEASAIKTAENLKEKMQPIREKQVYDKGALKLEHRQKQLKEFDAKNSPSGGNKSAQKQKDPKADNWVYKLAGAGVGGGIVLSMANNKGQQSNSQLYGQGGY